MSTKIKLSGRLTLQSLVFVPILFILAHFTAHAQTDSARTMSPYRPGVRLGVGYQKAVFGEIGFSYHSAGGDVVSPRANCMYVSAEWMPAIAPLKNDAIMGLKAGFEYTSHLQVLAAELKYLSDLGNRKELVFTPKIGFGLWGTVNVLYGYNLTLTEVAIPEIGNHQFSIVCNLDAILFRPF